MLAVCVHLNCVSRSHCSLSAVTHAPFMRQCWGLLHKLAQCTSLQGWGS